MAINLGALGRLPPLIHQHRDEKRAGGKEKHNRQYVAHNRNTQQHQQRWWETGLMVPTAAERQSRKEGLPDERAKNTLISVCDRSFKEIPITAECGLSVAMTGWGSWDNYGRSGQDWVYPVRWQNVHPVAGNWLALRAGARICGPDNFRQVVQIGPLTLPPASSLSASAGHLFCWKCEIL